MRMPMPVALLTSRIASCFTAGFFSSSFLTCAAWKSSSTCSQNGLLTEKMYLTNVWPLAHIAAPGCTVTVLVI